MRPTLRASIPNSIPIPISIASRRQFMPQTSTTDSRSKPSRAQELQHYWDKHASSYDREMAFMERWLFMGGREWVCRQAVGDVLEVAIGTGRNIPFYAPDVRLTGVEFSPAMLELARQ